MKNHIHPAVRRGASPAMPDSKYILFVGGGTAGHMLPLFAVMAEVQRLVPGIRCGYVGLASDLESPLLDASGLGFERYSISAGKIHRYATLANLVQPLRSAKGFVQAYRLLKKLRPDAIFSKGGFVSVPVAFAAKLQGVPLFAHETDVVPGLANQLVGRSARTVFTAFPTRFYPEGMFRNVQQVGQPVSLAFRQRQRREKVGEFQLEDGLPLVSVIGGSQGAHRVNELLAQSWPTLLEKVRLIHICGPRDFAWLSSERDELAEPLRGRLFLTAGLFDDSTALPAIFQHSSVVVSRAGGTIAELAATGTPAILVPLSTASRDHQAANARVFQEAGAAEVFDEVSGTGEELCHLILSIATSPERQRKLGEALHAFDRPDAAEAIARTLVSA